MRRRSVILFPLPRIDEGLDLWQVQLCFPLWTWLVAITKYQYMNKTYSKLVLLAHLVFFEYNRLPFGLVNAPATFQRFMQHCFTDELFNILLVHIDGIAVFSSSFEQHLERLQIVFKKLREHGLKLKPSKCMI